jgi:hypothetical protein
MRVLEEMKQVVGQSTPSPAIIDVDGNIRDINCTQWLNDSVL